MEVSTGKSTQQSISKWEMMAMRHHSTIHHVVMPMQWHLTFGGPS
jgi:hypothetical protein